MRKKLLVLGLMCALGSIGYGFEYPNGDVSGNSTVGEKVENLNSLDKNFDSWEVRDKINGNINSIVEATDKNFNVVKDGLTSLEGKLDGKADKAEIDQKLNELDKTLFGDGTGGAIGGLKGQIAGLDEKVKDYADVKENAESALILTQQNENKINDLYANKVDNQKFEEHKKQQANKDKDQDDKIQANSDRIDDLQGNFDRYDGRLSGLENKVDNLDDKLNKGLSLMTAMNAVDFQSVSEGELAIGAGFGHYGNSQSVAVGVAYAPTQNLNLNMKYSVTAGDLDSFAIGAGASYKVRL